MPLARRFREVTAVESGAGAVRDLQFNAERAGLENLHAMPQTAEEHLAQLEKAPDFVVLDPPRTGLGKAVVARLAELQPRQITIVACDPATLARDLAGTGGGGLSRGADDAGGLVPADVPPGDGGAAPSRAETVTGAAVLLHYDIYQLVGDGDHLHHLLAFEERLHFFVRQGARFEFFLRRAEGRANAAAQFAVDLHHDLGLVLLGQFGVEGRPGLAEDRAFVAELLPDLLRDVGRERRQHQRQLLQDLAP